MYFVHVRVLPFECEHPRRTKVADPPLWSLSYRLLWAAQWTERSALLLPKSSLQILNVRGWRFLWTDLELKQHTFDVCGYFACCLQKPGEVIRSPSTRVRVGCKPHVAGNRTLVSGRMTVLLAAKSPLRPLRSLPLKVLFWSHLWWPMPVIPELRTRRKNIWGMQMHLKVIWKKGG